MSKEIDLRKILEPHTLEVMGTKVITLTAALEAMQEACNQTIDLCLQNAEVQFYTDGSCGPPDKLLKPRIDRSSILKTKKQIIKNERI